MKEIKFRAWDTITQGMCPWEELQPWEEWWKDDEIKLMQFTGLHDKNGKEIYEGDILHNDWDNTRFVVEFIEGEYPHQSNADSTTNKLNYKYGGTVIVGNIYESPDLLTPLPI